MTCTGENCDRANLCALYLGNSDDKISSPLPYAMVGGGCISADGTVEDWYECGPLGDYKWFEPVPTVGEEVHLELRPVCKCGTVIRDFKMENHIERHDGWCTTTFGWHPKSCPKCGRRIVGITVEEKYFKGEL